MTSIAAEGIFKMGYRLKTLNFDRDFKYLFRNGRKLENNLFKLWFVKNELSFDRFVISIPLSVDKRSTTRNELRRRTKEWIRKNLLDETKISNLDIMVSFKKGTNKLTKKDFYEELDKIFKQIIK
ncbi:MAG: ribonuclease P protein component [bacterium]|nr:ribonuclease P protein component [bacterium]